ncbi:hypothetical protein AAHC03_04962 [Spirometra sp. Aus1]
MSDLGIAEERIREYRKTFDSYDKKHNGHIAVEDVANCLRSAGFMPSVVEVENLLREVDTENNILVNGVSFDQFCQLAAKKEKDIYTNEDLIEAFQTFDTESTGFLSKDVLTEALCGSGEKLSVDEFEAMMKIGGLDADGHFYYANFVKRMSGSA